MLCAVVLAAFVAVAAGCGGGTKETARTSSTVDTAPASKGGTLRLGRSLEPTTLNPFTCACDNGSWQTMVPIFDTLTEFAPGTDDAKPGLATSWDVNADQTVFTFHLRKAEFSDGTPVTSADVKYALGRASAEDASYYTVYQIIKKVDTPDESTVVVTLSDPTPNFPWYVGFPATAVVPKALIDKVGDDAFGEHPVGSGPFMLKRWVKGQVVELVRNPNYWRAGQPYLDKVELRYIPNDNTRVLSLLSGDVDAVDAVPFSQVDQVTNSGQATVAFEDSAGMYNVWLNERYKPLDELVVRQALNYATPKDQIRQTIFGGNVDVANANMPKLRDWSPDVAAYPYDLDKAKALMAKSSKPDGFDLTISIVAGDQTTKQVVQVLQQAWAEIGVRVKVQQFDDATLSERRRDYQYEGYMPVVDAFTSDLPVQDEFAKLLFDNPDTFNARTFWRDPEVSKLVNEVIHTSDLAAQAGLWRELQQKTLDNPSNVPLIFPRYRPAVRSNVQGFQYVQVGWWRLEQVSLKR